MCLSLVNIVGHKGAESKILLPLTDAEQESLRKSAECLKEIIRQVEI